MDRRRAIDPNDPRAPAQEIWDRLSAEDRQWLVDNLPSEFDLGTPEGDPHYKATTTVISTLEGHYQRINRRIYLASNLAVYYPGERLFAPDLIAVRDVEQRERNSWIVSHEARGLDLALEVRVLGDSRKDFKDNVEKFARLGIPEYFAFDLPRGRLSGWRLPSPNARQYDPITSKDGRWWSQVLELDLGVENRRLRFFHGAAVVLDTRELIDRLSSMVDDATRRAEEELRRAEEQAHRAEDETRRADRLARRLRELGIDPDTID